MEVSVVITVLNEATTVVSLLDAFVAQTKHPAEVIIVDGGSTDRTVALIRRAIKEHRAQVDIRLLVVRGNRSIGRNAGIRKARYDWIASTDAGCVPQPTWIAELIKQQKTSHAEVVAGYYAANAQSPFEEAVAPYALVMPDKIDSEAFLPATRSMLIHKRAWRSVGGFDEQLSDNEDYVFARALRARLLPMSFAQKAVVLWRPRSTLASFAWMIFRFARGDAYAGIVRPKVVLIFARYALLLVALGAAKVDRFILPVTCALIVGLVSYVGWAISKNIRHAPRGWYWLPVLQVTADVAVMLGSMVGAVRRIRLTSS